MSENPLLTKLYIHENYFSPDECSRVIELAQERPGETGQIEKPVSENIRESSVRFIEADKNSEWIFKKLYKAVVEANRGFRFHLAGLEPLQVANYSEGGHYDWHLDLGSEQYTKRKLSASVQLCDDSSYEGGELEFKGIKNAEVPRGVGSLVIFPSYLLHRVKPVTRGLRQSLVVWVNGNPFS